MPMAGVLIQGEPVEFENVPSHILAPEIVSEIQRGNGRTGVHLTDLTGCPHETVRKRRYNYYVPPESVYRMVRGKAWDMVFQSNPQPETDYQLEVTAEVNGTPVIGTIDIYQRGIAIRDTKAPAKAKYTEVPSYYARQLNGYRWLLWKSTGFLVPNLYLNVCGQFGYAELPVEVYDINEWEYAMMEALAHLQEVETYPDVVRRCDDAACFCWNDDYYDYARVG